MFTLRKILRFRISQAPQMRKEEKREISQVFYISCEKLFTGVNNFHSTDEGKC